MDIARICHLFYPDTLSDYFFELSMKQVNTGNKVNVFTWNKNNRPLRETISENFEIHRLSGFNFSVGNSIIDYPFLPKLAKEIRESKPEIIHCESHLFLTTVQALEAAKKFRIPSVVTIHGVIARRNIAVNLAQYLYICSFGLRMFQSVKKVICLTKSDAKEIIRYGCPIKKIRIVPNAIDTERFKPCNKKQENLIVWAGRFVPEKGINCLIEATRLVLQVSKDAEFLFIGDGPLREKAEAQVNKYCLQDKVHFTGPVDRDKVAEILGRASVFILTSLKEGLPLSLLEAMASGAAVIGSKISSTEEVIVPWQNGLCTQLGNAKELADNILTLSHDNDLRKKLGQKARESIIEKYNWESVLGRIERVYCEAVEETITC